MITFYWERTNLKIDHSTEMDNAEILEQFQAMILGWTE